jgi:hypothetical protein
MGHYLDKIRRQQRDIDWLADWRHLAELTSGIEAGDPRLAGVLTALDACDTAFLAGDYSAFTLAAVTVEEAMKAR